MTDMVGKGGKRGRGRPRGTTADRWAVREAILDALASARINEKGRPTNAEIIADLKSRFGIRFGSIESAKRIVRDEKRALLALHAPPHPTNPLAGLFDLPMATEADLQARDARVSELRAGKRTKAAERYAEDRNRPPGKK